ncbi:tetratricopeptide repeat protein [Falsiroseomonas oryziterrae]|uniref:tetratricopeptide repeat protein n=1 Tax=Falsiroseomonas oryziterrae TaxID=2911368 RepID=UPI001F1F0F99|nr:tetratricopeptide repeat protein [Roseomonas sp. NPKOSM-4]
MSVTDQHGNAVTCTDRAAVEKLDEAVELMLGFRADPLAVVDGILAERPDFAMAHAFRAGLMAMSMEQVCVPEAEASVAAAWSLPGLNEREHAHLVAAQAWADGDFALAHRRYAALAARFPRDIFAQQVAHQFDFFLGDPTGLRDRPAQAMQAWREGGGGFSWLLGMQAFGLEECGQYEAAEDAGRRALALQPRDAWALHAVAHVMEMQGRDVEGVAFLTQRTPDWEPAAMLAVHNWWHRALFHLERGEMQQVLGIYDSAVAKGVAEGTPQPAIEMVDASAMLWRLLLRGADTGGRFALLSAAWERAGGEGFYAFSDLHAVMAHLGAGREAVAAHVIGAMRRAAAGQGTNARLTREVGLPLAEGFFAFARGDYAAAAELIAPVRRSAIRFGGSNAQRDVIALTLLEAALRGRQWGLARLLAGERLAAKPESPLARALAVRAGALPRAA